MDHSGIFGASVYCVGTYVRIGDNQGFENDYRRNNRVVNRMADKELFGISEQLESSHFADPGKMVGDSVSRQAAIEALDKRFDKIPMEQTTEILKLRKDLRGLPSIQSEQKRGRWIYGEDEYGIDGYHCDKCGFFVPWDYTHKFINYIEDYNFCPSCGADMRGEQDEY